VQDIFLMKDFDPTVQSCNKSTISNLLYQEYKFNMKVLLNN